MSPKYPRAGNMTIHVLNYIKAYIAEHGYSPSLREIAEEHNFASVSTARHHVLKLEQDGYIKRGQHHSARTLIPK
ncbi:MAG: hypothetical protein H0X37_27310 [Herpetosiphonaceae bacterium]|nr:hypothetical protein [Herpetosiphonaceae bacterium]